ncbi:MAG: SEC-C metal-binding domain-containing protein, partial [Candidatus Omnitrophota bacterium]
HEARRIDNQLRGRSGRQGDPGSSRFYVSLNDDLMRLFGSERLVGLMDKLGLEEGQVIEHPWVTGSIEMAQRRVEQHNYEIRKQLLEYDNVMNKQREIIYGQRRQVLEGISLKEEILDIIHKIIEGLLVLYVNENSTDEAGLVSALQSRFGLTTEPSLLSTKTRQELFDDLYNKATGIYEEKEKSLGPELMRHLERMVFLQIIDAKWKDHLYAMDNLREGIGLRAYGQRDPLVEYKREAFGMFSQMIASIEEEAVDALFKLQAARPERFRGVFSSVPQELSHPEAVKFEKKEEAESVGYSDAPAPAEEAASPKPFRSDHPKVGRNDPCPCGSGKKYKKCHGK